MKTFTRLKELDAVVWILYFPLMVIMLLIEGCGLLVQGMADRLGGKDSVILDYEYLIMNKKKGLK